MGDLYLYVDSLISIVVWAFALDHSHYARWLQVHFRDMARIKERYPDIYAVWSSFTVQRSKRLFSSIALDHAHEQLNAILKSDGGAIGLTENDEYLRRWTVSTPELCRLISEFECQVDGLSHDATDIRHHDQTKGTQVKFAEDEKMLESVIDNMGNPFCENSQDQLRIDTKEIADPNAVDKMRKTESVGKEQYEKFVNERLLGKVSIFETIPKNKLVMFGVHPTKTDSKEK